MSSKNGHPQQDPRPPLPLILPTPCSSPRRSLRDRFRESWLLTRLNCDGFAHKVIVAADQDTPVRTVKKPARLRSDTGRAFAPEVPASRSAFRSQVHTEEKLWAFIVERVSRRLGTHSGDGARDSWNQRVLLQRTSLIPVTAVFVHSSVDTGSRGKSARTTLRAAHRWGKPEHRIRSRRQTGSTAASTVGLTDVYSAGEVKRRQGSLAGPCVSSTSSLYP